MDMIKYSTVRGLGFSDALVVKNLPASEGDIETLV